jgi:dienelactone hydrolase
MKLKIQPLVALCDERINICVSGLPQFGKVRISASMSLPWAKHEKYESYAWFTADASGNLDLATQRPDSGTYGFIDSMGLIVSMKRNVINNGKDITQSISVNESILIDIEAECEQNRVYATVERLFKTPEVKSQKISNEFVGELFYTENSSNKTIVVLGGSSGDLGATLPISSLLASRGFNVLALAYFQEKGLPAKLAEIPLEYFERVFAWLMKNSITNSKEIQVLGISKGGELALLLASRYSFITKVAAFAPHAYCFQATNYKNVSSWTYEGKSLPFIRLKNHIVFADIISCFIKNKPFGFTYTYKKGVDSAKNKEAARIKIENAKADILLFAGKQDNIWNAYDGCIQIMEDLRKHNFQNSYDFYGYEEAGHPFYAPYIIPVGETMFKLAPRLVFSSGGNLAGNAYAQVDSWEKAIGFFRNTNNKCADST